MFRIKVATVFLFFSLYSLSQNDVDAIRYSRSGIGGTGRSLAMGGAFGAIGADLSCSAYNPAGLALYRKGDLTFSGSLKITNNTGSIYNKNTSMPQANFAFNNFGIALAWKAATDPDSRNVLAFSNTQTQNFNSTIRMSGYTNNSSIAKDMLNLANQEASSSGYGAMGGTALLYSNYEGMGFNTYLLDTAGNNFFSALDTKRTVKQTRDLTTSGKVNDINLSYAYCYKDQFYLGASLGLPQVNYVSTVTHTEVDDLDSMRVTFTSPTTYTDTYVDGLPAAYSNYLGFNNLTYTEYFKTTGSGINLKLGGIARVNDALRVGFYYHTPTVYNLSDTYYNSLNTAFDYSPYNPISIQVPTNGGYYSYKIITPSRISLNGAYIIDKIAIVSVDYEAVNYRNAKLKVGDNSSNPNYFDNANSTLKNYYKTGHNLRVGGELNVKPVLLRAGYSMQGSPFGKVFVGDYVRNTFSLGIGVRSKNNLYADLTWYRSTEKENYYLFYTLDTQAKLKYRSSSLVLSAGLKF